MVKSELESDLERVDQNIQDQRKENTKVLVSLGRELRTDTIELLKSDSYCYKRCKKLYEKKCDILHELTRLERKRRKIKRSLQ